MSIKMNDKQKKAVELIDSNLVVNAGAGTGKTTVLVERYLRLLEKGNLNKNNEVDSIVAITFTKKAAQEMIERIRVRIKEKMEDDSNWEKIYLDIENANISTIHSFCANIIRENTLELGIDPKFEILDDNGGNKLLDLAIDEAVFQRIEQHQDFMDMLVELELLKIIDIREIFKDLYNKIRSNGFKIDELHKSISGKINDLEIDDTIISRVRENVEYLVKESRKNSNIYKFSQTLEYSNFINGDYTDSELILILKNLELKLGKSSKLEEVIENIKKDINLLKGINEKDNQLFYDELVETLKLIDETYINKKRKISSLDYEDLQISVNRLLNDKRHREYYQNRYRYLMIDEFQDTNELQREIFYKLASKESKLDLNNLFVVGDPKQSIYAFRGGDLDVFYNTIEDIKSINKDGVITLDDNYRTNENLIEFINDLFSGLMGEKYNSLVANNNSLRDIEIEVISNEDLEYTNDMSQAELDREYEAEIISKRILGLIDEGFSYKDIVLLFRAGTRSHIYEDSFRKYNIPCYNLTGSGLLDQEEIIDVINLIKAFVNFDDYISNIGFLRSPMINFSDELIYLLMKEEGNIVSKLSKLVDKHDDIIVKNTLDLYLQLENDKKSLNSIEFIERVLQVTLYKDYLLLTDNGKQKYGNVDKFISLFLEYEQDKTLNFHDILFYIDELRNRKLSEAKVFSENADTVRMMTIHKSKGLEFPVVIIPELSTSSPIDKNKINYHKNIGLGLNIDGKDSYFNEIKEVVKLEDEEEKLRILYVAMTRAEKLLILGNQGKESGFKAILGEALYHEKSKNIAEIQVDRVIEEKVRLIKTDIKFKGEVNPQHLIEFDDYNHKTNKNLSISQYMEFKKCNRKFYLDKNYRLSKDLEIFEKLTSQDLKTYNISPLDKGNIIHRFCEIYRNESDRDSLLEKVALEFGYKIEDIGFEINSYISNFINGYSEDFKKIYREKEFSIDIDGYIFSGVIDRINIDEDYIEIIDYKTNKVYNKNILYKTYEDQIRFYVYILEDIFNKPVNKGVLNLLETGESIEIDISKEKVDETINNIREFVKYLRENKNMASYKMENDCDEYCVYKKYCDLNRH